MCGRYVAATPPDQLAQYFDALNVTEEALPPSWNVAPTREVYAVAERSRRDDNDEVTGGVDRRLGTFRWGLVPSWAKDPSIGPSMINARAESVATKPAFRKALERRRCLVPADAFYEWERRDDGTKQPYLVRRADGGLLVFAGLWEGWRDAEGQWLRTCSIITTEATGDLTRIHNRCPALLPAEDWADWLDRSQTDLVAAQSMLRPAAPDQLEVIPVSNRVGDVRNDSPDLLDPVEPEPEPATLF